MVTKKAIQTTLAECPDCGERIGVEAPVKMKQRVRCPNCEADLEVVETVPVELDWYYEEEMEEDGKD